MKSGATSERSQARAPKSSPGKGHPSLPFLIPRLEELLNIPRSHPALQKSNGACLAPRRPRPSATGKNRPNKFLTEVLTHSS